MVPKKILVVKNDKIGDMVMTSGIFRELRNNFPLAEIIVVTSKANKPLIERNKNISKIFVLDYSPRKIRDFKEYLSMMKKLRREKIDLSLEMRGSFFNILFLHFFSRIKKSVGFGNSFFGRILLNKSWKKERDKTHSMEVRREILEKGGEIKVNEIWPQIVTNKEDLENVNAIIKKNNLRDFICLIPDASNEIRQWPLERFDKVIKFIHKKFPQYSLVITGVNKKKINFLHRRNPFTKKISIKNLREVYLFFKKSEMVLCQDGGAMHLAWAGKNNLVALVPEYLFNWIRPLGKNSHTISKKNIKDISVRDVKKEITSTLAP